MSEALLNSTTPVLDVVAPLLSELKQEVDEQCRLLGPFALVVQGIMGAGILGSLLLKRMQEKPRRKWKIWFGDITKQMFGQVFVHSSNVLISDLIARHQSDNPCSLYALNIAVDTTLGVLILYGFIRLSTRLLLHYDPSYRTGDYGDPPSFKVWAKQCAVYVGCLSAMKIVVVLLFWAFPVMFAAANWALGWLKSDEAQVLFVMLIFPLVMNVLQFLIIDSILKSKPPIDSPVIGRNSYDDEEAHRGFLEPRVYGSDDESDSHSDAGGDGGGRKYRKSRSDDGHQSDSDESKSRKGGEGKVFPVPSPGNSSVNTGESGSAPTSRRSMLPYSPTLNDNATEEAGLPHSYPPVYPSATTSTKPNRLSYGSTRDPKSVRTKRPLSPPTVILTPPPSHWDDDGMLDEKAELGGAIGLGLGMERPGVQTIHIGGRRSIGEEVER